MPNSARPHSMNASKNSHIPIPRSKSTDQEKTEVKSERQKPRPRSSVREYVLARTRANATACFQKQEKPGLSRQILKQARMTGQLNLSNKGMIAVPDVVWNMNSQTDFESQHDMTLSLDSSDGERWWDYLDLSKLIMASNKISSISPEISNLVSLTILDLHDNQLTCLPDSMRELKHLTKLHLSHNRLTELPECVFQLTDLRILLVSYNQLNDLSDDIGNLSRLEELDLSHNQLQCLPNTIGFLSRVTTLNLSSNCLTMLPPDIGSMSAVRTLELTRNKLTDVPDEIGLLTRLEQLYLRHNQLEFIPDTYDYPNLKEFHVGNNKIKQLSDKLFESMVNVHVLDLRDNQIGHVSEGIAAIHGLERLDLTNNNLSNLPNAIANLPHLKSLSLDGNPLRFIRRDILQRGTVQLLRWLKDRQNGDDHTQSRFQSGEKVSKEELLRIYDKYTLRNARALDISNRGIAELPKELVSLASEAEVTVVDLSKNALTVVPECLDAIAPQLTELKIGFNRLTFLPDLLGSCERLAYLDLRNNQLFDLPSALSSLKELRELVISFNRFKSFPSAIFEMSRLEILIVSDNGLQELPWEGLSRLSQLATLDVSNNDIMTIPPQIGNMTQLRSLQLEGNPFRNPRPAILAKGTQALLDFLRDRIPAS